MKAVPALATEAPHTSSSRDQDLPHGSSSRHATGCISSGGAIPSHLRNITHSPSPSSPTPACSTTTGRERLHRKEEEPGILERSLDGSCKNSIHQNNDYAEHYYGNTGNTHYLNSNQHGNHHRRGQDNSKSSSIATGDDNNTRQGKRHSLPTTSASSFASAASTYTIPPTTPSPPAPALSIHTTLSTTSIPSSSPPPRTTTSTIPITTHKDRIIRASTTPPRNPSKTTTRTPSPMQSSINSSSNNNNSHAHRSTDVTGLDGLGMGSGGGATGVSSGKRLSISTQLQRASTSRDAASPTALAELDGLSNNNGSRGPSAVGMNENAARPSHARSTLAGGSVIGGQWKPNTLSLSSSSSVSPLNKKYEPVSKSIDHSEGVTMPMVCLSTSAQQQQTHSGTVNGSGLHQQPGRQSQPAFPATATATTTTTGSTFLQQNSNTTEMDTFSETHSGVIMAYPNTSSSHQASTTANGPGCTGLSDFVRSLFSQSLVSRLYSHRPRFSSVSVGTSSWSAMRVFNTCHLLYLIPVTTITIARLVTVDMICNEQLYSWLTVQAFLFLSQILSTCNILQRQIMMISSSRTNVMDQRARIMLLVFMIWTVIGVGFLGSDSSSSQDPCSTTNDLIYSLSFKIIIFHVSVIGFYFLPCNSLLLARVFPNPASSGMTRTATKPMIDKLGSTPMVEGMFGGDAEEATCAICLGDYKPDEIIRFLPCQHHFHLECVDQWLATDKSW
ncbi:hypothetical protein BGZ47_009119 [Haplosporangium gracile]|nr:hypothetical protein BGZ47_009119 [Haplosporangium gracile]